MSSGQEIKTDVFMCPTWLFFSVNLWSTWLEEILEHYIIRKVNDFIAPDSYFFINLLYTVALLLVVNTLKIWESMQLSYIGEELIAILAKYLLLVSFNWKRSLALSS